MKRYTIKVQNCIKVEVDAETPEDARMKLIECDDLWHEDFLNSAIIHNPIKEISLDALQSVGEKK